MINPSESSAAHPIQDMEIAARLIDTANVLWITLDPAGKIIEFNRASEAVSGYTRAEAVGRFIWDFLLPPEEIEEIKNVFQGLIGGVGHGQFESHLLCKDGQQRFIAWSNSSLRDASGRACYITGVGVDITERRAAEDALRVSEKTLKAIIAASHDGILMADEQGQRIILANPAMCELLGYTREELLRMSITDLHRTEDLPRVRQHFETLRRGDLAPELEMPMRRKDGATFPADISAVELELEGCRYFVGSFRDVTQRQLDRSSLARSKANLDEAQRLAHVGSWELDLISNQLFWSDQVYRLFEIDPKRFDASYQAFLDLVHPEDREKVDTAYRESVRDHTFYDYIHRLLMPDGRVKYVNERGHTFYDADGIPIRSFGTVQDITKQYLVEQALRDREEEIRLLLESTSEAIYGVDTEGICTFVNQACLKALGYKDSAELLGQHQHNLIHHHHADGRPYPAEECRAYAAYKTGQPGHVEGEVFWRKDGSAFPVEYWAHPVCRHGVIKGAVVAFFDVTEKRQAELHLRQAAAVFENTHESIMVTDTAGHITAVNPAFTEITGYSEQEALGMTPRLVRSERHGKDFYANMWASINAVGHWRGEVWNRRKSGEVYAQLLSISAIRDDAGQPTHYVAVSADISRLKQFESELEHLAHHDTLTGLPNRLLLQSRIAHALELARREGHKVAVLFLDVDHFKQINDSLGHLAGDSLLQQFAARIKERLREGDTLARLGGDEFVILLERLAGEEQATQLAAVLLDMMRASFHLDSGHEVFVSTSIGICLYPEDGLSPEDLLKNADAALYQAKELERGTYHVYTESLTLSASTRLSLETRLRHALKREAFVLHYQAQHDADGGIVGVEALVRWDSEEGLVSPDQFVPVMEETGLIVPLGEWVLRQACLQAQAWRAAGLPALTLAVNISARQFRQANLIEVVRRILRETGFNPADLELEITETAMMERRENMAGILAAVKDLGIQVAIDDFGTGYSSLLYLKRFPVDKLKIDRGFVRDIPSDGNDMEIAATIIAMGLNLNLKVIAEGVETREQLSFLKDRGCTLFQGYLFSKPMPAEEITRLLEAMARDKRHPA